MGNVQAFTRYTMSHNDETQLQSWTKDHWDKWWWNGEYNTVCRMRKYYVVVSKLLTNSLETCLIWLFLENMVNSKPKCIPFQRHLTRCNRLLFWEKIWHPVCRYMSRLQCFDYCIVYSFLCLLHRESTYRPTMNAWCSRYREEYTMEMKSSFGGHFEIFPGGNLFPGVHNCDNKSTRLFEQIWLHFTLSTNISTSQNKRNQRLFIFPKQLVW